MMTQMMDAGNSPGAVRVARTVEFSMAHLYRQDLMSEHENLKAFGACFTPNGHGHNYRLEVLLEGQIDPETGLLLERSVFDAHLQEAVRTLDHHHANFDVAEFKSRADGQPTLIPTTENLCLYIVQRLRLIFANQSRCRLVSVRLYEMPDLWVEWTEAGPALSLVKAESKSTEWTQEVSFRAVHRLGLLGATEVQNQNLYGRCAASHGHHYRLQVMLRKSDGSGDVPSGLHPNFSGNLVNQAAKAQTTPDDADRRLTSEDFERILSKEIYQRFDGQDLNLEFSESPATTLEGLLKALSTILKDKIESSTSRYEGWVLSKLAIFDGEKGFAEMQMSI